MLELKQIVATFQRNDPLQTSIAYNLQLPFIIPPNFETFDFLQGNSKIRLVLERGFSRTRERRPNAYTNATLFIGLNRKEREIPFSQGRKFEIESYLENKYSKVAFRAMKRFFDVYRKLTGNYYGIDVIRAPTSEESLVSKSEISVIAAGRVFSIFRTLLVKENVVAGNSQLDKALKTNILSVLNSPGRNQSSFDAPLEYLGAARIALLDEQWNLCVLQSLIAIESALSVFILKSNLSKTYREKRALNYADLVRLYAQTQRLYSRFSRFLFPILLGADQSHSLKLIRKCMRDLFGRRHDRGIYALRNRIVHEGGTATEKQASSAIRVAKDFISTLTTSADVTVS